MDLALEDIGVASSTFKDITRQCPRYTESRTSPDQDAGSTCCRTKPLSYTSPKIRSFLARTKITRPAVCKIRTDEQAWLAFNRSAFVFSNISHLDTQPGNEAVSAHTVCRVLPVGTILRPHRSRFTLQPSRLWLYYHSSSTSAFLGS